MVLLLLNLLNSKTDGYFNIIKTLINCVYYHWIFIRWILSVDSVLYFLCTWWILSQQIGKEILLMNFSSFTICMRFFPSEYERSSLKIPKSIQSKQTWYLETIFNPLNHLSFYWWARNQSKITFNWIRKCNQSKNQTG